MNILFCHDDNEVFNHDDPNVIALKELGHVYDTEIDYNKTSHDLIEDLYDELFHYDHLDLIVGVGLGGWLASHLSEKMHIPFIACNPIYDPSTTDLELDYLDTFDTFSHVAHEDSLVFFDYFDTNEDPIFSPLPDTIADHYRVIVQTGSSCEFEHMEDVVRYIKEALYVDA